MKNSPARRVAAEPKPVRGKVRIRRHTIAELEQPDGTVQEVERDEVTEFDTESDFFKISSSRTVHRTKTPI